MTVIKSKGTNKAKINDINLAIGNRLMEWREAHHYLQKELLNKLNEVEIEGDVIGDSTLSRYESGQVTIPTSFLYRLHLRFGADIDIEYIVTGHKVAEHGYDVALRKISDIIEEALKQ